MTSRVRPIRDLGVVLAAWLVLGGWGAGTARGQDLVADLSSHLIAITTGFTGTEVVLFGSVEDGGEVAVVVRGPSQTLTVRRKARTLGIWVNVESMDFTGVPSFYWLATSAPLDELAEPTVLARHGIGVDHLRLPPADPALAGSAGHDSFRAALVRNQQERGLYSLRPGRVAFLGQRLFRTNLFFPANVPTGQYTVSVLLFRDGVVASAQTTPLIVSKIGVGAAIFAFAQQEAAAYGLAAISLAVATGWIAGVVFRRP